MDDQAKSNTIFIANLNPNTSKEDIKNVFKRFGKILSVGLIRKRPESMYAFIEFDDMRDAVDAVMEANLTDLRGKKLRIEYRNGGSTNTREPQLTANGSTSEAAISRMEAEEDSVPAKAMEQQFVEKAKTPLPQDTPLKPDIPVEPEKPRQQSNTELLATVNELRKSIRDLESRVQALERDRHANDSRYSNRR